MSDESFKYIAPRRKRSIVVFCSPHSGREYSESFVANSILDSHQIRTSEDAFVDQLFDCAPDCGAPLLLAMAPRAFVDLNRRADELDGAIIQGVRKNITNPRVASGLGVIPRVVAEGQAIQMGKMTLSQAQDRLDTVYHPYHNKLKQVLSETRQKFDKSILIDCHSMPHAATASMVVRGGGRPDVVLGDRFGASCSRAIMDAVELAFVNQGFSVSRNVPFAGAYIVQEYGRPSVGQHAVQVELDRSLYMDEACIQKHEGFEQTRLRLRAVVQELILIEAMGLPVAAQ
jgi:N-formylglutamate amidohydrolase